MSHFLECISKESKKINIFQCVVVIPKRSSVSNDKKKPKKIRLCIKPKRKVHSQAMEPYYNDIHIYILETINQKITEPHKAFEEME